MSHYLAFLALVSVVTLAPGPDTFLTLRNTAALGRTCGIYTMLGIALAGATQGLLAATGLGALIVHAEPVFQAVKWAGICYLIYLGITAIRAALRGAQDGWESGHTGSTVSRSTALRMFRQGFLCNITNPKVLVFNLAVLPQFIGRDSSIPTMLLYALSLTMLGVVFLFAVVMAAHFAAERLASRRVRRTLDGSVGAVMIGFAAVLAAEG